MANGPLPEIIEYVMCPFSPVSRSWAARHSKFDILPTFSVTKTYNKKKKISLLYMNIQTAISLRSTSLNLRKKNSPDRDTYRIKACWGNYVACLNHHFIYSLRFCYIFIASSCVLAHVEFHRQNNFSNK